MEEFPTIHTNFWDAVLWELSFDIKKRTLIESNKRAILPRVNWLSL